MSGEGKKSVLVLISTMSLNRIQQQNQQRAMLFMKTKAIPFESIDGADPNCKERRNELFKLSGMRGEYPQFFLIDKVNDSITFLGNYEKIEAINDASSLPVEVLEANPSIQTWENVMS